MEPKILKLNLGSGTKRFPDFINVDQSAECNPDIVWNLENTPWPFETNSISHILMSHCLEHIGQTPKAFMSIMQEIYRICINNATIEIVVPHPFHDNFASDPTHVRPITATTLALFDRRKNEEWKRQGLNTSLLAFQCGVDFEIIKIQEKIDAAFLDGLINIQSNAHQHVEFFKKYGRNIIIETYFQLSVRKNMFFEFNQYAPSSVNFNDYETRDGNHHEHINALLNSGDFDKALLFTTRIINHLPADPFLLKSHGALLARKGQITQAIKHTEAAARLDPEDAETQCNLGVLYTTLKDFSKAASCLNASIKINSHYAEAYNALGVLYKNQSIIPDALSSFTKAINLSKIYPEAYLNRANSLFLIQRYQDALADYHQAIAYRQNYAEAYCGKGNALTKLQQFSNALQCYDVALDLKDNYWEAFNNRAITYLYMERPHYSLRDLNKAIEINPHYAEAFFNRGNANFALGQFLAACDDYDRSKAFGWPDAEVKYHKSLICLLTGDLRNGFANYEFRRYKKEPIGFRAYNKPLWDPAKPIHGKTIFVYAEQGLGDTIQFSRYIKILEESGARVLFEPQPVLSNLLTSLDCSAQIVAPGSVDDGFDFHIPLMSLPYAFGTTLETVPRSRKYLEADESATAMWRKKIGTGLFTIAVCWQCSQRIEAIGRSIPISMFETLSSIPNVRLLSLQKSFVLDDSNITPAEVGIELLGDNLDAGNNAFIDAAAIIKNCDLVISCDTSIAHLAGALGIPVWIALKKVPHWTWLNDRSDSPWYPNARIFRQSAIGNWGPVFQEMRKALILEMRHRQL